MSMYYQLTKSQKKIARSIMEKGLYNHYEKGLKAAERIITKWENGVLDNKEAYMELYKNIHKIDKQIAQIYDGKGGSRWIEVLASQLATGVIETDDLKDFDDEIREIIILWSDTRKE